MGKEFVDRFRLDAEKILRERRIVSIEFSGSTYQVEVLDVNEDEVVWPFLQFDEEDQLADAFCSCGAEETCPHLAAAFLRIYNGTPEPLHTRFKRSFWFHLTFLFADLLGSKPRKEIFSEGRFFSIWAKRQEGKQYLHSWIEKRPKETPETSLKFSNLSPEEITHWKEGRASSTLRYELSFWSDLAKYLMLCQDEKKALQLSFEDVECLPLKLKIETEDFVIHFHLLEEDLEFLIPSLATVESPLKVEKKSENGIEKITYFPEQKQFKLTRKKESPRPRKEGKRIGEWNYIQDEGFYAYQSKNLLTNDVVQEEEIPAFLDEHADEITHFLPGLLHKTPQTAHYDLEFDSEWNWHFSFYVFTKRDSTLYGNWAYVEEKGFYPIKGLLFDAREKIIPSSDVSTFVHYHRNFLNSIPGFSIHLAGVESAISYTVSEKGHLRFMSKFAEESIEMKDFGDWVYYKGQGFFPKRAPGVSSVLFAGLEVPARDIPSFIKVHRDELETITHFFSPRPLVASRGLRLSVKGEKSLEIEPECLLFEDFRNLPYRFYGDFIYVERQGFEEMPPQMRLPIKYQEKITLHERDLHHFFDEEFKHLKPLITTMDPRAASPLKFDLHIEKLEKEAVKGLEMEGSYVTEYGEVSLTHLREALGKKYRFLFSKAGRIDLQDERLSWISKLPSPLENASLSLSTLDFLRLDIIEGVQSTSESVLPLLHELRSFQTHEEPELKGLKSDLRLYQKSGLEWLWFLYRNGLSGLLCDEMGLGKTHQAMAMLAACKNLMKEMKRKEVRYLIVAPTSVIYHWEEKLKAFLPEFKVHFFHGLKRSLKTLPKTGILLTSYGILRSERKEIEKIPFEIAIFDEIQVAKNPSSRVHDALLSVQAKMRIGLTGTPIENYLREIKALFDLVLPGYMPGEKEFRENFILPIEKEGNPEKKALLTKMIKPFTLRRKKQEVLSELPEKTEDKVICELTEEQLDLYKGMLEKERKPILEQLNKGSGPIPYVHIFSIISKLKQICNHPALFLKDSVNYKEHHSGKWDLFVELLTEAIEGEQKVVVFSQYLQQLDIFGHFLKEKGWDYAEIRGDTLDRKEQMDRFREDPKCLVFLGSLQAAGLGIDLTSASIVILYDRWWNAARENQAIDRVHRIGQKWGVQVFKLITQGTVEEKIDLIIARKGRLMEEIITSDDEATIKKFSREDLIELFSMPLIK